MNIARLYLIGFLLLFVGSLILFASSVNLSSSSSVSYGGVIFIGPFPIAFGSGPNAGMLILISVGIAIAMILALFLPFLLRRRVVASEQG